MKYFSAAQGISRDLMGEFKDPAVTCMHREGFMARRAGHFLQEGQSISQAMKNLRDEILDALEWLRKDTNESRA